MMSKTVRSEPCAFVGTGTGVEIQPDYSGILSIYKQSLQKELDIAVN